MRGEHLSVADSSSRYCGSSPHAWGALSNSKKFQLVKRFIPTCVGSMPLFCIRSNSNPVHPHMRGEHAMSTSWKRVDGSSPHAWGASEAPRSSHRQYRFIPTCVGSMARAGLKKNDMAVHPHMRGEHRPAQNRQWQRGGSSPHAWGASTGTESAMATRRFIPTCVGSIVPRWQ